MEYSLGEVRTKGFTMEYMKFGSGGGTLVILPGLSLTRVLLAAPAVVRRYELFAEDFTVYVFERRSDLPKVYSVEDMARDTADAMESLGLSGVNLFGASQGGMIAMLIAAERSGLVKKLILGSTALCADEKRIETIGEWVRLARSGDRESLCLSFGEKVYPRAVFEENRAAFSAMAKMTTDGDIGRFIVLAEGTRGFSVEGFADKITCPVMVMGDTSDEVLGAEAAKELCEKFKGRDGFESCIYSGFGHAAYDTAPDFPRRMYDFIKENNT